MHCTNVVMPWPMQDRRVRRSGERSVALRYQLEHSRERGGLEVLVLADTEGLLLGSSGDRSICAELGAMAPLIARSAFGMPMPPLLSGADVRVRRLEVYGQPLFLACAGGGVALEALLEQALRGVKRILQSN